ncbi:PIN domain-containing protein [Paracidovorax valerianellae]|uniref:Ribonuclease VapC n=1 Tax=Paracidovorax valerianellae TaxID=187868 RepID=A0A1G6L365_9BURK|nr:PIN domain-containing protein [Paracidovorax valerianellae]MDA8446507.1 PIN domain-containing protein [Paracidovorax valerianellae]SDC37647.1 Predicted nucleic acid-binding protein, contains PIN domain [Paracidovorax valerianellae]
MVGGKAKIFLDSNVVLYLLSENAAKADDAEKLLQRRPIISVQVLNEVTHVCVRKLRMGWGEVGQFLALVREFCKVVPLTVDVHDRARQLAKRHQLSFYDACIIAAAAIEGCQTLYTEDMHHGLIIEESLSIRNPFNT